MRTLKVTEQLLKTSLCFNVQEELEVNFLWFTLSLYVEKQDKMVFGQHIQNLCITNRYDCSLLLQKNERSCVRPSVFVVCFLGIKNTDSWWDVRRLFFFWFYQTFSFISYAQRSQYVLWFVKWDFFCLAILHCLFWDSDSSTSVLTWMFYAYI